MNTEPHLNIESITTFRSRVADLMRAEVTSGNPRALVVLAIDGLSYRVAQECWPSARLELQHAVLPTTSSAGWLSALSGLPVFDHGVPGVIIRATAEPTAELINVFDHRGHLGTAPTLFDDAQRLNYSPVALLGDLAAYDCSWRDLVLGPATRVATSRFFTSSDGQRPRQSSDAIVGGVATAVSQVISAAREPVLAWIFIELDRHIHYSGYDDHARQVLYELDTWARDLAATGQAVVLAHTDHGLTPTVHDPDLANLLTDLARGHEASMGGAGRIRWFYLADPTRREQLIQAMVSSLPADVRVGTSDELFPAGSPAHRRVGEVLVTAEGERFLTDPSYQYDHGSATADEVRVPFAQWS